MCNPAVIPIAMAVMSAAATAYGQSQQNKATKAQAEAATEAGQLDVQQLKTQMEQTNDAATREKLQRQLQTARERATIRVSQGEAGVAGGQSSIRVLNNSIMQGSMDVSTIEANRANSVDQSKAGVLATDAKTRGRINTANAGRSSGLMSGLLIGGSGVQGAMSGMEMNQKFGIGK